MIHNQKHRGFTLIEMLVAITIFAIVATISYSSLSTALLARERTEAFHKDLTDLQIAIQIIDKDFRQIINRSVRDPFGGAEMFAALQLGSSDSLVAFTHAGWPNPLNLPRSELRRIAYTIEDNKLIRQHWQHVDRESASNPITTELIDNIDDVDITVIDQDNEPQTFWPIENFDEENQQATLPKGIEVVLRHQNWGQIRRVYEVVQ